MIVQIVFNNAIKISHEPAPDQKQSKTLQHLHKRIGFMWHRTHKSSRDLWQEHLWPALSLQGAVSQNESIQLILSLTDATAGIKFEPGLPIRVDSFLEIMKIIKTTLTCPLMIVIKRKMGSKGKATVLWVREKCLHDIPCRTSGVKHPSPTLKITQRIFWI